MKASIAGLVVIVLKVGPKLLAILAKCAKGLKLGKLGMAGATAASYSYLYSWKFALLIMGMLFIHESGHIWAMKRHGMRTKGIYFLPFLGAAAVADEAFPSRRAETVIAMMGPLWGLLLCFATAIAYVQTENPLYAAVTTWMAVVNQIGRAHV